MTRKLSFFNPIALLAVILLTGCFLNAQEAPAPEKSAQASAEDPAPAAQENKTPEEFKAEQTIGGPDYKKYVFIAYGLTCFLLFLFFTWTIFQGEKLGKRIEYLEERLAQSEATQAGNSQALGGHDE